MTEEYQKAGQRSIATGYRLSAFGGTQRAMPDSDLDYICAYADGSEHPDWRRWQNLARITALAEIETRWTQ